MVGVHQLGALRRNSRQHAQPGERVVAPVDRADLGGNGRAADAPDAVTAGHDVARELARLPALPVVDHRLVRLGPVNTGHLRLELDLPTGLEASSDQVPDELLLVVDGDALAATGQLAQREMVPAAVEAQLDARVLQAVAAQALADPAGAQELDRRPRGCTAGPDHQMA